MNKHFQLSRFIQALVQCSLFALSLAFTTYSSAAGTLEGKIVDSGSERRLENAQVTIIETGQYVLTDSSGYYRMANVPVGEAHVRVFYTGFNASTQTVRVKSDVITRHDVDLGSERDSLKLDRYVVTASRQLDGDAIAINEQRFASNMKSVIASDEFGTVAGGNVAQFMKFIPGVQVQTDANAIKLGGVPSEYTPVTVNGFDLASAGQSGTSRVVEVDQISLNNIARVEVINSPTPESPGTALAGSVNFVAHSAFDRTKPIYRITTYLSGRSGELDLEKTPGPREKSTRKILPAVDFSFIVPVSDRFGYTITGGASQSYIPIPVMVNTWTGAGSASNGTTLPDTTPDNPYLTSFNMRDGTQLHTRASLGATMDYRIGPNTRISVSMQYGYFGSVRANRFLTFNVNRVLPGNFGPTFTQGATGAGDIVLQNVARARTGRTIMPTFTFRHDGPIWKMEAGAGLSHANNEFLDTSEGYFNNTIARRTGVTIGFTGITYNGPQSINVTDGVTGAVVDPYKISSFAVNSANSDTSKATDIKGRVHANIKREFTLPFAYLALKGGLDLRQSVRDIRGVTAPYTFVGQDGMASTSPVGTSDDAATRFLDVGFSQRPGLFGQPPIQWLSNERLWEYYQANPTHMSVDENSTYINTINLSKRAEEIISAGYIRADLRLLDQRLNIIGGVRAEQTNITADGPLNDPSLNFQRDASGNFILGGNGRPLPISTNTLEVTKRTRLDRGKHTEKEYIRWLPSLNASYKIRENLIARAAYYTSLGRPDFNQYAGPLTLPDLGVGSTASNRITVNNAGIKAWSAQTSRLSLEYYFGKVGVLSAGVFRREFENFFETTISTATPEFLELYNLDPGIYGGYNVSTQTNATTTMRMGGVDLNYKQALTFLPNWARGIQVFANASFLHLSNEAAFNDFTPRTYNWGIKLTRPKVTVDVSWNYKSDYLRAAVAPGRSIEANTGLYTRSTLITDLAAEYRLSKRYSLYFSASNLTNQPVPYELQRYGPGTPDYAKLREVDHNGTLLTLGLKGTF